MAGACTSRPAAATDDGLLDVVTIGDIGRVELVVNLRRLFDGSLPQLPEGEDRCAATAFEVETSPPARVQADGELLGEAPVTFSVLLARRVRVIVA